VSSIAVSADYSIYWIIFSNHLLSQAYAASLSYLLGLLLAYFLLITFVFKKTRRKNKKIETILFLISGLIGTLVTFITIKTYQHLYLTEAHLAKIIAISISFIIVYCFRKFFVFRNI
jgi:putative flippase GtrA